MANLTDRIDRSHWLLLPIALFVAASMAITGVSLITAVMNDRVRRADAVLSETALDLGEAERLRSLRERVARNARTFLVTNDDVDLRQLREAEAAFQQSVALRMGTGRSAEESGRIARILDLEGVRRGVTDGLIERRRVGGTREEIADALQQLQPAGDSLDAQIAAEASYRAQRVELARAHAAAIAEQARLMVLGVVTGALLIAALSSFVLSRALRRLEGKAERKLRHERERFFELSVDMICVAGTDGYFKQLSPSFKRTLGHRLDDLLAKPFLEFVHPDDRAATVEQVAKLSDAFPVIDFENRYRHRDGSYRWLSWHALADPSGRIYAVARDVTERKETEEHLAALTEELRVMAVVDELTQLHNRRGFMLLAEQALEVARRNGSTALLFFADLDGLKRINDELGHEKGDEAIRAAAGVLRATFRKSDILARLGGDEFVALCYEGAADPHVLQTRLDELTRQFNNTIPRPAFRLSMSVGVTSHGPKRAEPVDELLARADKLMYERKVERKATRSTG